MSIKIIKNKIHIALAFIAIFIALMLLMNAFQKNHLPKNYAKPSPSLAPKHEPPSSVNEENEAPDLKIKEQPSSAEITIDARVESFLKLDLCDDPSIKKEVSASELIQHYRRNHDQSNTVAATTESLIKGLCSGRATSTQPPYLQNIDSIEDLFENSKSFQESAAFIDLLTSGETNDLDPAQVNTFVRDKLSHIDSLHEFLETMSLFREVPAAAKALKELGYPVPLQKDVADYSSIAAACRIFGGCAPSSAYSISLCFLICERPMGAEEFARESVPKRQWGEFDRAVDAIISARNPPRKN